MDCIAVLLMNIMYAIEVAKRVFPKQWFRKCKCTESIFQISAKIGIVEKLSVSQKKYIIVP